MLERKKEVSFIIGYLPWKTNMQREDFRNREGKSETYLNEAKKKKEESFRLYSKFGEH